MFFIMSLLSCEYNNGHVHYYLEKLYIALCSEHRVQANKYVS